jgi:tripartite-type tricarboxylate transporter receptor subunit TctC
VTIKTTTKESSLKIRAAILTAIMGATLSAAPTCHPAQAEDQYPSRVIKIVVPTSPGAITDIMARAIGQALSQAWSQSVIVDNRPGGDELIGGEVVAKSAPDGYTLLLGSNGGVTASPHLHKQMRYDPQKDLAPIFLLGQVSPVMLVPAPSPVKTVQDLIALAKSKPGELNYGSFGNGSYSHVAMEDFKQRIGIQIMHIPYRGAAPAYTALLRGETAVMIANLASATGHANAGTVRIIAAAGPKRSVFRPDLPTIAESGVPGFSTGAWWALFAPAKLPPAVFNKIRSEIARIAATPEMKKISQANTLEPVDMTPEQLVQFIHADSDNWARQIKAAGIEPN